jgi:hypothetical protein
VRDRGTHGVGGVEDSLAITHYRRALAHGAAFDGDLESSPSVLDADTGGSGQRASDRGRDEGKYGKCSERGHSRDDGG